MFGWFKPKPPRYGGLIAYFDLKEWWAALTEEERRLIRYWYTEQMVAGGSHRASDLDGLSGSIIPHGQAASQFLNGLATFAMSAKSFNLAEKMLDESLRRALNPIDRHFAYIELIDAHYKQREAPAHLERCIEVCLEDISRFTEFKDATFRDQATWSTRPPTLPPRAISFERLAIIHEAAGRYQEAIEVCDQAMGFGLSDGTKGGFAGRKARLEKKLGRPAPGSKVS